MDINKKLKILFITYTHSNGGGAEKVLTTLVNNLDKERYDISIFEIVNYNVKKEPINENIKLISALYNDDDKRYKIEVLTYILEKFPHLIKSIKDLNDFDFVISWNYQKPSFMLPAFKGKKIIAWFHESINSLDSNNTTQNSQYYRNLQIGAWGCADKIVAISNKSFMSLGEIFPQYLNKTKMIYNPIDLEDILKKAKQCVMFDFKKYNFPFLACIGRLDKNKNVSLVIQSLAKLNRMGISCGLLIIGIGEEESKLKTETEKLEVSDKVFFLGYQQNPMPYLKQSKILCVASFAEGFPTVVCEAMALGRPFVTTPIAGASEELAYGGKCGLVVGWDVEDYTEKLKKLLTDTVLYNQMSKNCLERIKDFSVENAISSFDSLIASLFDKKTSEEVMLLSKKEAFKKVKTIYVWYIGGRIKRVKFSISRFMSHKSIYHFMLLGYHILFFLGYILCTPIRFFSAKRMLLQ